MVSLITVNFNNYRVTFDLLCSVERLGRTDLEAVVVDNGSAENPEYLFKKRFPWVRFVRSEKNLGFAGGNNLGIQHARGEYYFFINNDTEFKEDIIDRLLSVLRNHQDVGVVCPTLYYYDQPAQIQYAGYTNLNPITGRNRCLTQIHQMDYEGLSETQYAHGAAMMVPRRVVQEVGGMPESYFLYFEELDWSARIRKSGHKIMVDTQSAFFHKESQTVGTITELKSYFLVRNRILFMRRNMPAFYLILFWLYFLLLVTPQKLIAYTFRQQFLQARAHLAGIAWNIRSSVGSQRLGYKFDYLRNAI